MLFLIIMLVLAGIITFLWLMNFKDELKTTWYALPILSIAVILVGVFCVKSFAWLENAISGTSEGNMSIYGGIFFMPVFCVVAALIFRRDIRMVLDIFTLPVVVANTLARVNCLVQGCCRGSVIPGTAGSRWPTREVELVFDVAFLIFLVRITSKKQFKGLNYSLYFLCYGVLRFVLQWFREEGYEVIGPLTLSHLWSILSILVGVTLLLLFTVKYPRKNIKPTKAAKTKKKNR